MEKHCIPILPYTVKSPNSKQKCLLIRDLTVDSPTSQYESKAGVKLIFKFSRVEVFEHGVSNRLQLLSILRLASKI